MRARIDMRAGIDTEIEIQGEPYLEYVHNHQHLYLKYEGKKILLGSITSHSEERLDETDFSRMKITIRDDNRVKYEKTK